MARKKPQTKRERLESLIQQACHYAEWNLREYGQVPPSAMALTKESIFLMTPPKLGSESEKDKFADAARMLDAILAKRFIGSLHFHIRKKS